MEFDNDKKLDNNIKSTASDMRIGVWQDADYLNQQQLIKESNEGDIKSQEILKQIELLKVLRKDLGVLQSEKTEIGSNLEKHRDELKQVNVLIVGVVFALFIAFLLMFSDFVKEKDLYLNYNLMIKQYYDESKELNKRVDGILKDFEILRIKNNLKQ